MGISFPTGKQTPLGHPERAQHCICEPHGMFVTGHDCLRCGKPAKTTISHTWQQRAAEIAAQHAKAR